MNDVLTDPDVLRWKQRLERAIAAAPAGVELRGMDEEIYIVDTAALVAVEDDMTRLGGDSDRYVRVESGSVYTDSGGW